MAWDNLKGRLDQLIEVGEEVLSTRHPAGRNIIGPDRVNDAPFHQWKAGTVSFLKAMFGDDSTHFKGFQASCTGPSYQSALIGVSILKAAKEDIEGGYLKKLETLVTADVFTDFLEMAEYLLEQGYKDPAASLIGAVLEDGLRKIAANSGVTIKRRQDISSLNGKLADAKVYNRLIQKRVQVWNDVRNHADHGEFSEYTAELVTETLAAVRDFLAQYV